MTKQEIIEKANTNIESLIVSLLDREETMNKGICVNPEAQYNNKCKHDCRVCRNMYIEKRKNMLRETYYLKA